MGERIKSGGGDCSIHSHQSREGSYGGIGFLTWMAVRGRERPRARTGGSTHAYTPHSMSMTRPLLYVGCVIRSLAANNDYYKNLNVYHHLNFAQMINNRATFLLLLARGVKL